MSASFFFKKSLIAESVSPLLSTLSIIIPIESLRFPTFLSSKSCYTHNFPEDAPKIKVDLNSTTLCGVISKSSRESI